MAKKKEKDKSEDAVSTGLDLASVIKDTINSDFKGLKVASFIDSDDYIDTPEDWLSTGSTMLDLAISNRPNGGYPLGRIVEIYGKNSSGKSLLAYAAIKQAQLKGGIGVCYDTEGSASNQNISFLEATGIDPKKFIHVRNLNTLEDIFTSIESLIIKAREKDKKTPIVIVIDSIMGATTKIEMEADYDKDGYATSKALILSKAMRKITELISREKILLICINQVRDRLGISFGDKTGTSGGQAIGFHASVRISIALEGKIKAKLNGEDEVVGVKTNATIKKNRVGPPFRTTSFNIYFNSGIDDSGHWFEKLSDREKIIKLSATKYQYTIAETGEVLEFTKGQWRELLDTNEQLRSAAYKEICDLCIMKYKVSTDMPDNVHVDTTVDDND